MAKNPVRPHYHMCPDCHQVWECDCPERYKIADLECGCKEAPLPSFANDSRKFSTKGGR